jgi:hypothetical protein
MSLSWYMVHDASGNAVSMGTVVANPLPNGLSATALTTEEAEAIMAGESRWDAATLAVVSVTPPVPEFVTRWQIRTKLWRSFSVPPESVAAFIDSIQDEGQRVQARIDWDGPICRRDHPMVEGFAAMLGLTASQTDQVFREANDLET